MLPSSSRPWRTGTSSASASAPGRPHVEESTGASGACRTAAAPCADTARPAASATAGSSVSADGASAIRWLKSNSAS